MTAPSDAQIVHEFNDWLLSLPQEKFENLTTLEVWRAATAKSAQRIKDLERERDIHLNNWAYEKQRRESAEAALSQARGLALEDAAAALCQYCRNGRKPQQSPEGGWWHDVARGGDYGSTEPCLAHAIHALRSDKARD